MKEFVHIIILPCRWLPGNYVTWQSTRNEIDFDVYIKPAANLITAMTDPTTRWVKQTYQTRWTRILFFLYWDNMGAQMLLFSNHFEYEKGITVAWRYLNVPTTWNYAQVVIPNFSKWAMQIGYSIWGCYLEYYTTKKYTVTDLTSDYLPYYGPRKKISEDTLYKWAARHPIQKNYPDHALHLTWYATIPPWCATMPPSNYVEDI